MFRALSDGAEGGQLARYARRVARARDGAGPTEGFASAIAVGLDLDGATRAMLEAHELVGKLDVALQRAESRLAVAAARRRQILRACAYPVAIWLASAFLLALPLYVFRGGDAFVGAVAREVLSGLLVALAVLAVVVGVARWTGSGAGRDWWAALPWLGGAARLRARAEFTSTWAACLSAGFGVHRALDWAGRAVATPGWNALSRRLVGRFEQGASLQEALQGEPLLGQEAATWLAVGEKTGTLDQTLEHLAEGYETAHTRRSLSQVRLAGAAVSVLLLGLVALRLAGALGQATSGGMANTVLPSGILDGVFDSAESLTEAYDEAERAIDAERPYRPLTP